MAAVPMVNPPGLIDWIVLAPEGLSLVLWGPLVQEVTEMNSNPDRVSGWSTAGSWFVNVGTCCFVLSLLYLILSSYLPI